MERATLEDLPQVCPQAIADVHRAFRAVENNAPATEVEEH